MGLILARRWTLTVRSAGRLSAYRHNRTDANTSFREKFDNVVATLKEAVTLRPLAPALV